MTSNVFHPHSEKDRPGVPAMTERGKNPQPQASQHNCDAQNGSALIQGIPNTQLLDGGPPFYIPPQTSAVFLKTPRQRGSHHEYEWD